MHIARRMSLEQAGDQLPALYDRAIAEGATDRVWDVFECSHCDCGCRRLHPVKAT
jgi:hypothetical protein